MWLAPDETTNVPPSLVSNLNRHAAERSLDTALTFLVDGDSRVSALTYGDLHTSALRIAASLSAKVKPGGRVIVALPPGVAFVQAFFGCLFAGIVAVPVHALRTNDSPQEMRRLDRIAASCEASCVLVNSAAMRHGQRFKENHDFLGQLLWLEFEAVNGSRLDSAFEPSPETIAFLQYTSGSTSEPKGVIVTHGGLAANFAAMAQSMAIDESSVFLSWLPPSHDMGLIGNILQAIFFGSGLVLMSPMHFLQRPLRWLSAIGRYRATHSGGPSFAYDLCVRRTTPEQRTALDLRSWRLAFNGAEPVRADTMEAFAAAFAASGFSRGAFLPCYGLAEATLYVSSPKCGEFPLVLSVDKKKLQSGIAVPAFGEEAIDIVSCGRPPAGHEIAIVDPDRCTPLPDGVIGEIWTRGPSTASGYWALETSTRATFMAQLAGCDRHFMRTGDLGFRWDRGLYVTGRLKDLIILRGRNIYPQDIEFTIEQSYDSVQPVGGAAFGESVNGEERLVLVQEVRRGIVNDPDRLARSIAQTILEQHEIQAHRVVLIRPGSLPKTTSGKIRRSATRMVLAAGDLPVVAEYRHETLMAAVGGNA